MATRRLLADLAGRFEAESSDRVVLEAVGGVDAAARVRAGDERCDVVVLGGAAIDELIARGHLVGPRIDVATSAIAVAVRAGGVRPDVSTVEHVRRALVDARAVAYSTGPSGVYLSRLFATWDPSGALASRLVLAPPGVPVATLLARGDADLGFQQLSELIGADGIDVVGLLPDAVQMVTTFSGAVSRASTQPDRARALLTFLADAAPAVKRAHGMDAP